MHYKNLSLRQKHTKTEVFDNFKRIFRNKIVTGRAAHAARRDVKFARLQLFLFFTRLCEQGNRRYFVLQQIHHTFMLQNHLRLHYYFSYYY